MLLDFINRHAELGALESRYARGKAEFMPVFGRRRVGKTELLKQFMKNKPHFYFLAKKKMIKDEMERFRLKFSEDFNVFIPETKSWDAVFEAVLESQKKGLVIVIDEFPFWVEKDKSVLSDFQHLWDETLKNKNIFLVLCGSYVSIMENDVLGYKSPLYGRRTGQLHVGRLGFKDFVKFFPGWKLEEIIKAYGALDGMPFYIKEFELEKSFAENVKDTFWNSGSVLNKEVEFLLSQELREVEVYLGIMRSIFEGATKLNEIAAKSRVEITNINKYLRVLENLRFIFAEYPVVIDRPKRKNSVYRISDNFFNFWMSYVYPFRDDIEVGELEHAKTFLEKDYSRYMGHIFESVCRQSMRSLKITEAVKIGRWWYNDKEIDIMCIDERKKEVLFAECKWSDLKEREAMQAFEALKEKSGHVKYKQKRERFCIFGKTIKGKENLRKEGCLAFDLDDIQKALKKAP